jgi:hypothetical protein
VNIRNAHIAVVERRKIVEYILNDAHPDNGGKARFFMALGFTRDAPEHLIGALTDIARHGEVVQIAKTVHGEKYVVDGWLSAHTEESNRQPIRTVWIIDRGTEAPRLVTAYPGKE